MKTYGLIGFRLSHSFSKKYFTEKFLKEGIEDCVYENFQLDTVKEFSALLRTDANLKGFNVTIPYKEEIIPFLNDLDAAAKEIGAVNVIKIQEDGTLIGYNSDYYGFKTSLETFIPKEVSHKALVLGTGGAAKAVVTALNHLGIPYQYVSRNKSAQSLSYEELDQNVMQEYTLVVNTSPLGMYPEVDSFPAIPYEFLDSRHYLYDLVYNPEETLFMKKGIARGAHVMNGLPMLIGQAEKAWEIWNSK
ncbi:shikimate dehydrogenase family protein [Cytophaga hutchinsonii]|uniref:Shikimate dehydrogenase n=1 Tax=Cytophaga hutchinsonii (strain ATCC 33406 / DSM 1761 / CIP 103989 / NBRC 15051 / NCIMB 9469 / D465) TaxID=269798 RepID=A0A6N4SM27_CYTH3|nr:shikimate dehydrogenase [Cytophaga hutchinsonii]ABG57300.1 shikimate dehydrogenase [Cytophaga hutchinsonii ATCC 33406]SFX45888.1 shikimate dehydrogenase [Cytophaga hutchinsonii ATCC 33406]